MKDENKLKKWKLSKWKKELWKVFAQYIKLRDNNICFTCGSHPEGCDSHAGHFRPKSTCNLPAYFSEDNVHCQCAKCNLFLQGNQYEYGRRLGEETVDKINKLNQGTVKWTALDYLAKIKEYEVKLQELN